jgi:iron only hydrogenase large subunit-like protein
VLHTLDTYQYVSTQTLQDHSPSTRLSLPENGRIFVASVSPQTRASIAATYGVSVRVATNMIDQLLQGSDGLRQGGRYKNGFNWIFDTNTAREACLVLGVEEVEGLSGPEKPKEPKQPVLTSACPGWICYAEKTHPHILPHLSRLKSPQALLGTLIKTSLSKALGVSPDKIWHVAIMPCFDKKLEASREELTDSHWSNSSSTGEAVRDVDCVITTKELLMLADSRGIDFGTLPHTSLPPSDRYPFPDTRLSTFFFPRRSLVSRRNGDKSSGSSGGYLYHIVKSYQASHAGSLIHTEKGRNADVVDYTVKLDGEVVFKAARYYGFRNIQNLVRKLKPAEQSRMPGAKMVGVRKPASTGTSDYQYVEVMACPGGCTNGGGQIRLDDAVLKSQTAPQVGQSPLLPKQWQARVDEAYFSEDSVESESENTEDDDNTSETADSIDGISSSYIKSILEYWATYTKLDLESLAYTSYRKVESDVGKHRGSEMERVVELSSKIGGGW